MMLVDGERTRCHVVVIECPHGGFAEVEPERLEIGLCSFGIGERRLTAPRLLARPRQLLGELDALAELRPRADAERSEGVACHRIVERNRRWIGRDRGT